MSDSLLQRVASGDMDAVQQCMDTYGGLVWSLARRLCFNLSEAEDAVQEIFIELWRSADRFDPSKGSEATFIATIARRRLIDRGRRVQGRERTLAGLREQMTQEATESPLDPVATQDKLARVREAVELLAPDQRRVLQLAVSQGLTHEQIARATELPLGTVKTHARRGLIRVRAMLAESEDASDGGDA